MRSTSTRRTSAQRYLAYTGPVVLATLLGVHLANRGRWSFLAYDGKVVHRSTQPASPAANPAAAPLKITLKNYTPHHLKFLHGGQAIDLPSLGTARCQERVTNIGSWDAAGEIPRVASGTGRYPDYRNPKTAWSTWFPSWSCSALPERSDLAYPHGLHRDSAGTITGFSALAVPERQ